MKGFIQYVKDSFNEFKNHVTFPTKSEVQQATTVVTISTVILSLFLFGIDSLFKYALAFIYSGLNNII